MVQKSKPNQNKKNQDKIRLSALRERAKKAGIHGRLIWLNSTQYQHLCGLLKDLGWEVNSPRLALAAWAKNKSVESLEPEIPAPSKPIAQNAKAGDKSQLSSVKRGEIGELMLFDFPVEVAPVETQARANSSDADGEKGGAK